MAADTTPRSHLRKHSLPCAVFALSTVALTLAMTGQGQAERLISVTALDAAPLQAHSMARIDLAMRTPDIMSYTQLSLHQARERAQLATVAQSHEDAMRQARQLMIEGSAHQVISLAQAIKTHLESQPRPANQPEDPRIVAQKAQTSLLLARAEMENHRPGRALSHLDAVQPEATPIADYVHWLRAQILEEQGRYLDAYDAYQHVAKLSSSPMSHRARVQKAHMLHLADQHERAIIELSQVNALYPDYPRRHISLYQYARSLEASGQLDLASQAYQQTWFEFPFKQRGKEARRKMEELVEQGHTVPIIDQQTRYNRWRRLRINKHWDTARALFRELEKEVAQSEGEKNRMVHEIWQQLALNALIPKRYEEALYYLEKLRTDYEAGERDGIDRDLMYKKLAETHAKFGDLDEALKQLDKAYLSRNSRLLARADFLKDHGRYSEALEIYQALGTLPQKGWAYSWLLYKSGRLTDAHKNFMTLAGRSSGRSQIKYLYWAARTKERLKEDRDAEKLYEQIQALVKYDYYSFQAANRLLDIKERKEKQAGNILVEASPVLDSGEVAMQAFEDAELSAKRAGDTMLDSLHTARSRPRPAHMGDSDLSRHLEPILCEEAQQSTSLSSICQIAGAAQIDLRRTSTPRRQPLQLDEEAMEQAVLTSQKDLVREQARLPQGSVKDPTTKSITKALHYPEHLPPRRERPKLTSKDNRFARLPQFKDARIFWEGPDTAPLRFVRYDEGQAIGPHPGDFNAYGEDTSYKGGLERLIDVAGDRFAELERAQWLMAVGMNKEARWAIRDVALEYRELTRLPMPRTEPHQLKALRMTPLIDNRRVEKSTWGYIESEYRWPVPRERAEKDALLSRQRSIISDKNALRPLLLDAMKEVGDYYMVRQFTRVGGIRGELERMQAYPRAFPELVIPEAKKWGVNPYLIWALMTVESSFNPDSVSTAEALGLLQVIPRTGLKTAELLGDEDFGHYDLLDEDVAIRHGVFYFSQLVRKFHGNELLAMAGYNGGPHRVAEWMDMRGDMPLDEFVEEIPYDQAREYTKKVSRFLHMFLRLYEGEYALYIGNDLKRDWRTMPNF